MRNLRLVVKRRDNNKQVSRMSYVHYAMLAEHYKKQGISCGILAFRSPKNASQRRELAAARKKFRVVEVVARNINNPEIIFEDLGFLVSVAEWAIQKRSASTASLFIDRIAKMLAKEQAKICTEAVDEDPHLKLLFKKYNPSLLTHPRGYRWWHEQLTTHKGRKKTTGANKKLRS